MSHFMIEDGKGGGKKSAVNEDNQLTTYAITETVEHYRNHTKNTGYHLVVQQTPTGANDCFLYIKNSGINDLVLEGAYIRVASAETLEFKVGDSGTAAGGSTATPVNLFSGSGNTAAGTYEAGNDITGLSGGAVFYRHFATSTETVYHNFEQDFVLSPGGVFTVYAVTGAVQVDMTIPFYEEIH